MKIKKWYLIVWLILLLFPLNWLLEISNIVRRLLARLYLWEPAHVVAHTLLFAGLVFLALEVLHLPLNLKNALLLAAFVLAVGLIQEFFQLQVKERGFGGPEIFDLAVDLIGGMLGWLAFYYYRIGAKLVRLMAG